LGACAALAIAHAARAGALDERVPSDAILYAGWAGADALEPQYANSNLKGILDASVIREFMDKQLPKLIEQAGQQNPGAPAAIAKAQSLATLVWKHPTAFYFCPIDLSNPQVPMMRFGLICDAGADAKELAAKLTDDLARAPQNPMLPVKLQQDGNVLILTFGKEDAAVDMKKGGGLAAAPAYKSAMDKAKTQSPAIAVYADVARTVAMVNEALAKVPNTPADVKEKVPATIDALGLNGVTQIAYTAGFNGKGWTSSNWIGISGTRKGILALFDGNGLSDRILTMVPKEAAAFSAWKLDFHKAFTEARAAIGKVDVQAQRGFDAGVSDMNRELGIDVEKEFIAPLGDEWVAYRAPLSDEGGNSFALVVPLKDAETFGKTLGKLEALFNSNPNVPVKIEKITAAKTEASTIAFVNLFSVAWAVKNGNLYVSTLGGIGGAIKQVENKAPGVTENELYKAARAALPANVKPLSLNYSNPAKLYPEVRRTVMGYLPIVRRAGLDIPMEILPDPDDVTKFMTPGAGAFWMEADGLHGSLNAAFPGADALGGQQIGPNLVAAGALGFGFYLPQAAQGRRTSTAQVDASNIRAIAQSTMVYASDHNDQMPDDLARLVADNMIAPRQLVSARSGNQPLQMTPELEKMAKENYAAFIERVAEHCDYVYLGKGAKAEASSTVIVLYERPSPKTADGISVAYADAHSDFIRWTNIAQAFEATNERRKKDGKPVIDTKAMLQAAGVGAGGLP
jgi:hypothetical protein